MSTCYLLFLTWQSVRTLLGPRPDNNISLISLSLSLSLSLSVFLSLCLSFSLSLSLSLYFSLYFSLCPFLFPSLSFFLSLFLFPTLPSLSLCLSLSLSLLPFSFPVSCSVRIIIYSCNRSKSNISARFRYLADVFKVPQNFFLTPLSGLSVPPTFVAIKCVILIIKNICSNVYLIMLKAIEVFDILLYACSDLLKTRSCIRLEFPGLKV